MFFFYYVWVCNRIGGCSYLCDIFVFRVLCLAASELNLACRFMRMDFYGCVAPAVVGRTLL